MTPSHTTSNYEQETEMTESKHTPGPWTATPIAQGTGDYCIHARGTPWQLAYLAENSQVEWPIEANARLIAAAPELLDALASLVAVYEAQVPHQHHQPHALFQARAVISKLGGTP